jgi:hypothetical protein
LLTDDSATGAVAEQVYAASEHTRRNHFKPHFPGFTVSVSLRKWPVVTVIKVALDKKFRTSVEVPGEPAHALACECAGSGDWLPLVRWLVENDVGNKRFRLAIPFLAAGDAAGLRAECEAREKLAQEQWECGAARRAERAAERAAEEAEEERQWREWQGRRYTHGGETVVWRVMGPGEYASEDRKWVVERWGRREWCVYYEGKLWGYFEGWCGLGRGEYTPFRSRGDAMVMVGAAEERGW